MERRDILKMIGAATGCAFVGGKAMAWDKPRSATLPANAGFTPDDIGFLNEVGEVIIPKTSTPGAKDANVGKTMAILITDCYTEEEKTLFRDGMKAVDAKAQKDFGKPFLLLDKQQKHTLISALNDEAMAYNRKKGVWMSGTTKPGLREPGSEAPLPHFFTLIKQLTLFSFFTSKVGATQVLRYVAIPGKYDGDLPYKKGDRAWAT